MNVFEIVGAGVVGGVCAVLLCETALLVWHYGVGCWYRLSVWMGWREPIRYATVEELTALYAKTNSAIRQAFRELEQNPEQSWLRKPE